MKFPHHTNVLSLRRFVPRIVMYVGCDYDEMVTGWQKIKPCVKRPVLSSNIYVYKLMYYRCEGAVNNAYVLGYRAFERLKPLIEYININSEIKLKLQISADIVPSN